MKLTKSWAAKEAATLCLQLSFSAAALSGCAKEPRTNPGELASAEMAPAARTDSRPGPSPAIVSAPSRTPKSESPKEAPSTAEPQKTAEPKKAAEPKKTAEPQKAAEAAKPAPLPPRKPTPQLKPAPKAEPAPEMLPPLNVTVGAPAWGRDPEHAAWTNAVRLVAHTRLRDFERAADKEVFCPGYAQASAEEKENCWVLLVAAVSKFESNFKPGDSFREPDGNYSVGLLALSPNECPNAPTVQALGRAVPNLVCGTNRMAALISRDGHIDGPESRRGASGYWSTLRAPYKRWDASRKRYLSLGKKNLVLPLVRGYRGAHAAKKSDALGKPLKGVAAELMSCSAVETLDETGSGPRALDFELSLRSSGGGQGVVAETRSRGRSRTDTEARIETASAEDAAKAFDIAGALYPEKDLASVSSVRTGTTGSVKLFELLDERGDAVAKVLAKGSGVARCGR